MKKKGLIISSIVMVVVLIASLTTATYAWFNTTTAASVKQLDVSVASTSNISLGIAKNVKSDDLGTAANRQKATTYVYSASDSDKIVYTENATEANKAKGLGSFSATKAGLGTLVAWDWVLSSMGGVTSSSNGTDIDSPYTRANALYNGNTNSGSVALTTKALFNGNVKTGDTANTVIFAPFGLRVEKEGMKYLYCDITITPKSTDFWGIIASLMLEIDTLETDYYGHPFRLSSGEGNDGLIASPGPAITSESVPTVTENVIQPVVFRFVIDYDSDHILYNGESGVKIYTFDIRMFLDGTDPSCIQSATQYGATIDIAFNAAAALPSDGAIVTNLYV